MIHKHSHIHRPGPPRASYEAQQRHFATAYGYRPSKARLCPRVVAGLRCRAYASVDAWCVCQEFAGLFDHGQMWLDPQGAHALTGEPYVGAVPAARLTAFRAAMRELGLEVKVGGISPWNPGATVLYRVLRHRGRQVPTDGQPAPCSFDSGAAA